MSGRILESNSSTNEDMRQAKKRKLILEGVAITIAAIASWYNEGFIPRELRVENDNDLERRMLLRRLYHGSDENCYNQLRLTKHAFFELCNILREKKGLHDTHHVTVEESVAMFLLILAHGLKMRVLGGTYIRSIETISRRFGEVLRAIIGLTKEYIKHSHPTTEVIEDDKWKWFKDCIGALDGTHVAVTVPFKDQGKYRNKKQQITTNVLGACDRNMKFVYVLPGWEGSSSDSRVLRSAMSRADPFIIPNGKYYLVDAGYTNGPGFLAPYRSTRYHLNEWSRCGNSPRTYKELFNLRHSSTRNVIERAFGLLKKRWAILRTQSFFDIKTQVRIINACCILHNYIRDKQQEKDDFLLNEVDAEISETRAEEEQDEDDVIRSVEVTHEWTTFRDNLAIEMFNDYQARRG